MWIWAWSWKVSLEEEEVAKPMPKLTWKIPWTEELSWAIFLKYFKVRTARHIPFFILVSPGGARTKNSSAKQETENKIESGLGRFLGDMVPHFTILAWKILWGEEPLSTKEKWKKKKSNWKLIYSQWSYRRLLKVRKNRPAHTKHIDCHPYASKLTQFTSLIIFKTLETDDLLTV